jgi:hypothetical protein
VSEEEFVDGLSPEDAGNVIIIKIATKPKATTFTALKTNPRRIIDDIKKMMLTTFGQTQVL